VKQSVLQVLYVPKWERQEGERERKREKYDDSVVGGTTWIRDSHGLGASVGASYVCHSEGGGMIRDGKTSMHLMHEL
jgi:hypothetical protein